ncbi:MAG: hypothetical protein V1494_02750 [Candidatus Diapherotrites archaeon]
MNKYYLRAVALSVLFILAGFFVINQIDVFRINEMQSRVQELELQAESSRALGLFSQTFSGNEEYCNAIDKSIGSQINRNLELLKSLDQTKDSVFLGDISRVKQSYFLSNAQLFMYMKQAKKLCEKNDALILYFYLDADPCPDCWVQGQILDGLREKCSNVRTFALPVDSGLEIISLLKSLFGVDSAPSVIINEEKVFKGLASEEELLTAFSCEKKTA